MSLLAELQALIHMGGVLMPPLVLMNLLLWWGLIERWSELKKLSLIEKQQTDCPVLFQLQFSTQARKLRVFLLVLVSSAPLVGLLGTVMGMIETFDSLAEMTLFSQDDSIAGGISQALLTTQMGLIIAIPGLILGRFLNRYEDKLVAQI